MTEVLWMHTGDRLFQRLLASELTRWAGLARREGDVDLRTDPGKVWLAAVTDGGEVAGWVGARDTGTHVQGESHFILPAYRGQDIFGRLVAARTQAYADRLQIAYCHAPSVPAHQRAGFKPGATGISRRGWWPIRRTYDWVQMVREPDRT